MRVASILQTVTETSQSVLFEMNRHWKGWRNRKAGDPVRTLFYPDGGDPRKGTR